MRGGFAFSIMSLPAFFRKSEWGRNRTQFLNRKLVSGDCALRRLRLTEARQPSATGLAGHCTEEWDGARAEGRRTQSRILNRGFLMSMRCGVRPSGWSGLSNEAALFAFRRNPDGFQDIPRILEGVARFGKERETCNFRSLCLWGVSPRGRDSPLSFCSG